MLKIAIFAMIRLVKHNSYIKFIDEMFLKCLTRAHTGDRLKAEVKIMKRLALPIILILALVLVTAFTYQDTFGYIGAFSSASFNRNIVSVGVQDPVLDEFVVEPEYGGFRYILLNIGRLDFMTAGVTQRYDEMMTESGIEHEFYLTDGGHDFSTWSDGLHTFVPNIFGAESDA